MLETTFSPLSFGKSFMKIRSAVPENGCLVFLWRTEKNKNKQKKNICKTYTNPPNRRLRKTTILEKVLWAGALPSLCAVYALKSCNCHSRSCVKNVRVSFTNKSAPAGPSYCQPHPDDRSFSPWHWRQRKLPVHLFEPVPWLPVAQKVSGS